MIGPIINFLPVGCGSLVSLLLDSHVPHTSKCNHVQPTNLLNFLFTFFPLFSTFFFHFSLRSSLHFFFHHLTFLWFFLFPTLRILLLSLAVLFYIHFFTAPSRDPLKDECALITKRNSGDCVELRLRCYWWWTANAVEHIILRIQLESVMFKYICDTVLRPLRTLTCLTAENNFQNFLTSLLDMKISTM